MKKFLPLLFFQSFLMHFVWEVTQMPLYLPSGMGVRADYFAFLDIHWRVSLFDALTVAVAYLLTGLVVRNIRWCVSGKWNAWAFFIFGILLWQIAVEYFSVSVYHRWTYAPAMPLVFGIGLSPLLQMMLLPPFAVFLSSLALTNDGKEKKL